ncbi:hypothetical protein SAMN05421810_107211 [Amycolatopsis arida]|uniref:Copper-transporting ATPase n=1 Tax=Amycolatopsis arida TaxID=587909 RepID=A0A1I5YJQ3_9PSEU|nr:DUF6541 family protein [Amycolatopsis arida]TDX90564.1 hypothetical protein CLV69_107211 [Amycolatopsis arida]SFQ44380.1 hypothetical protein SAMN05421810_107211 [Amycolatopsis arida]
MPTPDAVWTYLSTIGVYLVVLAVPGVLLGLAAGLRGWALAGLAPLFTYLSMGLAGPWLGLVGISFTVVSAAVWALAMAAAVAGLRRLATRGQAAGTSPEQVPWRGRAHVAVAACVALASVISAVAVLTAAGGPSAVFQRWDTVYHANGVRYIAETGDGSLTGMSSLNWYPDGSYYPNAYHLVSTLVYELSGATIPAVLNGVTVPIAGLFALSLVTLVREFGGRAVFAGATAIVAGAATTGAYESVSSGLLTFALGVVLTPLGVVAVRRFVVAPGVESGIVLALTTAGLLLAHTSALFGAALLALPMLVQRWWRREGRPLRDLALLLPPGLGAGLLAAPHLIGVIRFSAGGFPYLPWGADLPVPTALKQLVTFQQVLDEPQLWLTVLLAAGVLTLGALGPFRWLGLSAVLLSGMFVLVACYGAVPWVIALSRPWWNDRYRLMALAAIPLCLLAGHGLAELQRWLARLVGRLSWTSGIRVTPARVGATSAVLIVSALAVVTNGFYTTANATAVAYAYHNWPESWGRQIPVTEAEVAAMRRMGELAEPGEMVLNDRNDGTAWLYAIAGVRPVAAHYDPSVPPPDAVLLANHFREYATNPEVRAAVERLNVRHVLLGSGSIRPDVPRSPGLRDLDGLPFLEQAYRNRDAVIYTLVS